MSTGLGREPGKQACKLGVGRRAQPDPTQLLQGKGQAGGQSPECKPGSTGTWRARAEAEREAGTTSSDELEARAQALSK